MTAVAVWCYRRRWVVLGVWLAAVVGLTALSQGLGSNFQNVFSLPGTDTEKALNLLDQRFPAVAGDSDTVVLHVEQGSVTDPAVRQRVEPMLDELSGLPSVASVESPFAPGGERQVSSDQTIAYATVTFTAQANTIPVDDVTRVIDTAQQAAGGGLQVELGGQAVAAANPPSTSSSELIGVIAAAIILFIAFGSLLGMTTPLISAIVSIGTGLAGISLLSHVMNVADFTTQLSTLIGLGVGVDYALFIVTRQRSALKRGLSVEQAVRESASTAGRAVLFAGITVCIALLGMFALGVSFLYGLAVGASLVVLLTMLAASTLLPALLGFFGEKVLSRTERRAVAAGDRVTEASSGWRRWAEFVNKRPVVLGVVAFGIMAVLAVPFFGLRLGSSDQGSDAVGSTTRQAYDLLAEGFGPGFNGPLQLVAATPTPAAQAGFAQLVGTLSEQPGVASVTPPIANPDGTAAIAQVVPTTSPQDEKTSQLISRLRAGVIPGADLQGAQVYVSGTTAVFEDFASVLQSKLPLFIGVVVLLAFLLLTAVFRSVLIPLTASLMNLLAAGAGFGVVVAVFQWGWLSDLVGVSRTGPIEAFLPVLLFAILFGLSMDYEVFLVSRMHEEWHRSKDNDTAVTVGQAETGRVITAAAAIMVLVFGSFILGEVRVLKLFGLGLAAAVLLDALLIRTILVPSIMHLLGARNWWMPGWLDRVLPRISVEGPGSEQPAAAPGPYGDPGDLRAREPAGRR